MKYEQKQKKVEEEAYNCLELIADEIGVEISFYPEVYWVGKKLKFKDLGISYREKGAFDYAREKKGSIYLYKPKVVLIGRDSLEDISEEVGHFLHLTSSRISLKEIDSFNDFSLNALIEMFGFFCSKLIAPSRKNEYGRRKPLILENISSPSEMRERIKIIFSPNYRWDSLAESHCQGYFLGEELFNSYISNSFPKKKLKKLFLDPLNKKDEPSTVFTWMNLLGVDNFMNEY